MYMYMYTFTCCSMNRTPPTVHRPPLPLKPKEEEVKRPSVRRNKLDVLKVPFDAGYSRNCGGLGLTTYLLRFKYKGCIDQKILDDQLLHK